MLDHPNNPDNPENIGTGQEPDANGAKTGFLMVRVRRGDELEIGEAYVHLNEVSQGYVTLAIKAPRSVKIIRKKR